MACSTLRSSMSTLAAIAGTAMLLPAVQAAVISKIDAVPAGWTAVGSGSTKMLRSAVVDTAADTHVFTIALNLQNLDQLESRLLAVSTPGHASYGKYSDIDDIESTFGASADAVKAVSSWLESSGVVQGYTVRGSFVDLVANVTGANMLFGADYQYYIPPASAASTSTKLRTLSYSVPDDIAEHVALVDPGNYFGAVRSFAPRVGDLTFGKRADAKKRPTKTPGKKGTGTTIDAACQTSITPACLKQLYNVGDYAADANSGSSIGFSSFLNESASYSDLALYLQLNSLPSQNFSVELIQGGVNNQDPATSSIGEANLDVQNIVGVGHPLPVTEFITGGSPPFVPNIDQPTAADNQNEPYVPYYRYLLSKSNDELPTVISNSYGDEEDSVPYNYAVLTCNMIGLMGLRGITVLESSGDLGVGAGCLAPDNKTPEFNAIFPATCPYVTSVGGTVGVSPEIAWDGSSGGFSQYFTRPVYQEFAVGTYLAEHVSASTYEYYSSYTNWQGRGFPDVSAHSVSPDYQIVYKGQPGPSGGTSAAAPVWAAIVGLLNDARLRQGLPTLGFLNPLLYAFPEVLTDITSGQAIGCNGQNTQSGGSEPAGSGVIPGAFWNATAGWDPVTGYGTPDFEKMLSLVTGFYW